MPNRGPSGRQANGFSGGCSPVAVMQREHELGRLYMQGMAATVEAEETRKGTHEKYHALANELADRFGVPRVEADRPKHDDGCGCGH